MAKPSAGDFTGKQKKKLMEQATQEQTERAKTLAMATAAENREKSNEVVDYTKEPEPQPVETGPKDLTVIESSEEPDPTIDRIVAGTSDYTKNESGVVGEPKDLTEEPQKPAQVMPTQVQKQKILIRARYDMDRVTVGKGTFYDFEEGRQYFVPPNVARHLSERDLVDVLN